MALTKPITAFFKKADSFEETLGNKCSVEPPKKKRKPGRPPKESPPSTTSTPTKSATTPPEAVTPQPVTPKTTLDSETPTSVKRGKYRSYSFEEKVEIASEARQLGINYYS